MILSRSSLPVPRDVALALSPCWRAVCRGGGRELWQCWIAVPPWRSQLRACSVLLPAPQWEEREEPQGRI